MREMLRNPGGGSVGTKQWLSTAEKQGGNRGAFQVARNGSGDAFQINFIGERSPDNVK